MTPSLIAKEVKAFVPAKDFELSKRFYEALGFTCVWSGPDLAYFNHGQGSAFLLQNYHVEACTANFMMHLEVENVDAWWLHASEVAKQFGVRAEPPKDQPWGMRDFPLVDPSGVLWRVGQPLTS